MNDMRNEFRPVAERYRLSARVLPFVVATWMVAVGVAHWLEYTVLFIALCGLFVLALVVAVVIAVFKPTTCPGCDKRLGGWARIVRTVARERWRRHIGGPIGFALRVARNCCGAPRAHVAGASSAAAIAGACLTTLESEQWRASNLGTGTKSTWHHFFQGGPDVRSSELDWGRVVAAVLCVPLLAYGVFMGFAHGPTHWRCVLSVSVSLLVLGGAFLLPHDVRRMLDRHLW